MFGRGHRLLPVDIQVCLQLLQGHEAAEQGHAG